MGLRLRLTPTPWARDDLHRRGDFEEAVRLTAGYRVQLGTHTSPAGPFIASGHGRRGTGNTALSAVRSLMAQLTVTMDDVRQRAAERDDA